MTLIKNDRDLLVVAFSCDPDDPRTDVRDFISHLLYDHTKCGANITFLDEREADEEAWIDEQKAGVVVGSIVEGSDFDTDYFTLEYPFTKGQWDETIKEIEQQARRIWRVWNR